MGLNKVESAVTALFSDYFTRVKFLCLMLVSVTMIFASVTAQADMIFDFQMKMAQKGDTGAQFKVGEMYETGFGVKQDITEAKAWITKAAGNGHETAEFKLLYWDLEKNGMTKANKAKVETLKTKAKNNNPQALYYLGRMHSRGVGVKRNTSDAENWLNKAALAGVPEAESELVVVRERQLKQQAAKRQADEKKRAELKARQEREKQAKLEKQKQLKAQRQSQKHAEEAARAEAEEVARQDAIAEARGKENRLASEKAEEARLLKAKQAQQREAKIAAQQQALKKKQAKKQKASFESDPCSGKSARFLSTCR